MKRFFIVLFCIILLLRIGYYFFTKDVKQPVLEEEIQTNTPEVFTEDLYVPWTMLLLPDGNMLVGERKGTIKNISPTGEIPGEIEVEGVSESGEGGLMGMTLHPNFASNKFIYIYFTARSGGEVINKVVRYVLDGNALTENLVILENIPGGANHNGGRIAFGPDGKLYVTTGDSGDSNLAQDVKSLAGKILRVEEDGKIPEDNPFDSEIYSYGHRNPQGLAWDSEGNLWSVEHGRSGVKSGLDEVNLIEKGGNYGWPIIQGSEQRQGMKAPVAQSGSVTTWAPADLIFLNGKLYFTGLRGVALYETSVLGGGKLGAIQEHFKDEYGRLRALLKGTDGEIYFGTSNQDGRGRPNKGDDKIIKIKF
jgi:glucose/arabinose dehydrogenase